MASVTRVKVCGITNSEDIRLCAEAGANALGFVVEYPIDVPWNLDRGTAQELMWQVPPFVTTVIVVGDEPQTVVELTAMLRPHVVQLHGNEPLAVTRSLVSELKSINGVRVIKALRFSAETGKCVSEHKDALEAARLLEDAGVDAVVLDSVSRSRPAGTGKAVDWLVAREIRQQMRLPVILAGGLNFCNVGQAIATVSPYAVDVITGVENPVCKKDLGKLKAFFKAIEEAHSRPIAGESGLPGYEDVGLLTMAEAK
jgi:phosphoribosylanthranilate isomerase